MMSFRLSFYLSVASSVWVCLTNVKAFILLGMCDGRIIFERVIRTSFMNIRPDSTFCIQDLMSDVKTVIQT